MAYRPALKRPTIRGKSDRKPSLEYYPSPAISIVISPADDDLIVPDESPYNADPMPCLVDEDLALLSMGHG